MRTNKEELLKAEKILKRGGIGVMLTDTIYGVVGKASSRKTVERIYKLKGRNEKKPFIILIGSYSHLSKFKARVSEKAETFLRKNWPGPVSVILPAPSKKFAYLHRGTNSLAFRMPKKLELRELIRRTGPLVAPSANPEGKEPAKNIIEAERYFGKKADFYLDGGTKNGKPSKLVRAGDTIEILRK